MFVETCEKLSNAAKAKVDLLNESKGKYFVASLLAGVYVGLGTFLIMTVGGLTKGMGAHFRIFIGLAFGIALSLVIMAGSELFTGNNLVMTAGAVDKKVKWKDAMSIWGWSYLGNLVGSLLIGAAFVYSGAAARPHASVGEFIVFITNLKVGLPVMDLIFRGILCNMLVCLAVLCAVKIKSESGKLIMIFWALFAFITSAYEHSIANMSIFTAAFLIPNNGIAVSGMLYNIFWVTVGNFIGGSLLGLAYAYMGRKKA